MDDRNLRLHVLTRKAVVINRADIEIAAVAGAGQINLRNALGGNAGMERIKRAEELGELIVVQKLAVRHQQSGPSPHPLVGQRELAGGLDGAAEGIGGRAVRTVAIGKIARVLLKNAGGFDRV